MRKYILILKLLFVYLYMTGQVFTDPLFYDLYFETTDEDHLTRIITAECSICSEEEMLMVGSTVLNRVDSPAFPSTVIGVIKQPHQFAGYNTKWYILSKKPRKVAKMLLRGEGRNYEVLYFHTNDCECKTFKDSLDVIKKLKYHTYGRASKKT